MTRRRTAGRGTPEVATVPALDDVLRRVDGPLRASSLIVTVFGDIAAPRGGSLWLGTLCDILLPLGIDDGNVRTALSRLVADGWLERIRIGRNSFYALTPAAEVATREAAVRIYGTPPILKQPGWTLCFTRGNSSLAALRGDIRIAGSGNLGGTLVWPGQGVRPVEPTDTMLFVDVPPQGELQDALIARQGWPLEALEGQYRRIVTALLPDRAAAAAVSGAEAAALRVLAVHLLRRAVLKDPWLPDAVLGPDWPGLQARAACKAVWQRLLQPSEAWLDAAGLAAGGPLPPRLGGVSGW